MNKPHHHPMWLLVARVSRVCSRLPTFDRLCDDHGEGDSVTLTLDEEYARDEVDTAQSHPEPARSARKKNMFNRRNRWRQLVVEALGRF